METKYCIKERRFFYEVGQVADGNDGKESVDRDLGMPVKRDSESKEDVALVTRFKSHDL